MVFKFPIPLKPVYSKILEHSKDINENHILQNPQNSYYTTHTKNCKDLFTNYIFLFNSSVYYNLLLVKKENQIYEIRCYQDQ